MVIIVDTREKPRAIVRILDQFGKDRVMVVRRALNFGDYLNPENPDVVVDRKQNLLEVVHNVTQDRPRFIREIERANRNGARLIFLVEHSPQIRTLEDVIQWKNPRLRESPLAVSGERLFKILKAMEGHYDIEFRFCGKAQTGKKIIEILRGDTDA